MNYLYKNSGMIAVYQAYTVTARVMIKNVLKSINSYSVCLIKICAGI